MTAQTIADRTWLLNLLGPKVLAELTPPLTADDLALLERALDRDDAETVVDRLAAEVSR